MKASEIKNVLADIVRHGNDFKHRVAARTLFEQMEAAKFVVVEVTDGGTSRYPMDSTQVVDFLSGWPSALLWFACRDWAPGDAMDFPCGWIFCVNPGVQLDD